MSLFAPLRVREVDLRNRVFVSPMCQYSAVDGVPQPWHLVHLGGMAAGGAALVMVEATAVAPEGRISPFDTGLWNAAQVEAFRPITEFVRGQGAVPGIQLAHAGRKAGTDAPWRGGKPLHAWTPLAPSALPFAPGYATPRPIDDPDAIGAQFADAARRAAEAGFAVIELHMAHGYLLHEFLSPLTNHRDDAYGGPLENRMRLPLRVAEAVRAVWSGPLFARISATDWVDGGWDLPQSIELARALAARGVDLIDCSSGGAVPHAKIPAAPGYQVPFAEAIRREARVMTGAVGLITEPRQADEIVRSGAADAVFLARELLRDPHWPLRAARELGADVRWPPQYERAR
jgi:2,4-dienoyl-CoA reductase-like NADH-dependent reductase (Old Yellow Enzyme family)